MAENPSKPKREIEKDELVNIVDDFINSVGLWPDFKSFVEEKGYTVSELGFLDDE